LIPVTHLVLIPSYNTGRKLFETVQAARAQWDPVWVVIDGSTDGTGEAVLKMAEADRGLRAFVLAHNQGKGAACAARLCAQRGRRIHACVDHGCRRTASRAFDPEFMSAAQSAPNAMILGTPVFGPEAPA
jgi:glycosyltransferase involved in cell wall biosynthesis